MRRAITSDIHGNLEALESVLADIRQQDVVQVVCLGDVVGYGPDPCKCLDLVMQTCDWTILGNHDRATFQDPWCFRSVALQAIHWTRRQLDIGSTDRVEERWRFLRRLNPSRKDGDCLFVHGSARSPTDEYVFPEDSGDRLKMEAVFSAVDRYCLQGHTHIPGVFTSRFLFVSPFACEDAFSFGPEKSIVNVGSVGQPRDGDPRACYVVFDDSESTVHFRRVPYDAQVTRDKIYDIPELDNSLGDRLLEGR